MASNFAFMPFGISQYATVGGAAPATVSLVVINGTRTASVTNGNYQPSSVRIANDGTCAVFINFYATTGTGATVTVTNGMKVLASTVEVFGCRGQPVLAMACQTTLTTTICLTPGEGM